MTGHAALVLRLGLDPCEVDVTDWPPGSRHTRDEHPDWTVFTCLTHGVWWASPPDAVTYVASGGDDTHAFDQGRCGYCECWVGTADAHQPCPAALLEAEWAEWLSLTGDEEGVSQPDPRYTPPGEPPHPTPRPGVPGGYGPF